MVGLGAGKLLAGLSLVDVLLFECFEMLAEEYSQASLKKMSSQAVAGASNTELPAVVDVAISQVWHWIGQPHPLAIMIDVFNDPF